MKAVMLYRPNSEHAGTAESFVDEYQRMHPDKKVELKNLDTPEGASRAQTYGITSYPAILIMTDDGLLVQMWQGGSLPTINELDYYFKA